MFPKIDLITVVYDREVPFLHLQARSIAKNFSIDNLSTHIVVINDDQSLKDRIDLSWWGPLADRVRLLTLHDITYHRKLYIGWQAQQVCKLLAALQANDWSLVIDSKTLFVRPYTPDMLFDDQGRAKFSFVKNQPPEFSTAVTNAQTLFGADTPAQLQPFGVPFLFKRLAVADMIARIRGITQQQFVEWFEDKLNQVHLQYTEFTLYSAFICSSQDWSWYYGENMTFNTYNMRPQDLDRFDAWLDSVEQDPLAWTVMVKAKALELMPPKQLHRWHDFLQRHEILDWDRFMVAATFKKNLPNEMP